MKQGHIIVFTILGFVLIHGCKNESPTIVQPPPPCVYCPFDFSLIDFEPAWSPDGKTIAYVHGDTAFEKSGIYLIDTNGANKRIIYVSPGVYSPAWSPNGQWLTFSDYKQLYKMKINGDSLMQLTSGGENFFPVWNGNGNWIAYTQAICGAMQCGLWLIQPNGTQMRPLVQYGMYPSWNPSENKILYSNRAVIKTGPDERDVKVIGDSLWLFDLGSDVKSFLILLTGINYDNRFLRYSPDGREITFCSQPEGGSPQVWAMYANGMNRRQLTTTQGYAPAWSPDGEWIVYTDSRNVSGRLWLMRKDGSQKRQFTFDN